MIERNDLSSVDRSVGAMLSGEIAKRYGNKGLKKPDTLRINLEGYGRPGLRCLCGARRDHRS